MKKQLNIIPVPDSRLIPRYLLEQVKDRRWAVDEWYELQKQLIGVESNIVLSLIDKEHQIVGFIWLTVEAFDKYIHINTISVDPKYQRKSKLINFVSKYIREIARALNIDTVIWTARRTKALEKYGFQESEYKLMEGKV